MDILTGRAVGLAGEDALMGAQRKSYTPAFRREAAHLVIDSGRTIAEVAREIGVGEQLVGRWVSIERGGVEAPAAVLDVVERAELDRLRGAVAGLRMDREFLEKAVASSQGRRNGVVEGSAVGPVDAGCDRSCCAAVEQ